MLRISRKTDVYFGVKNSLNYVSLNGDDFNLLGLSYMGFCELALGGLNASKRLLEGLARK